MAKILLGIRFGIDIGFVAGAMLMAWYTSTPRGLVNANELFGNRD